jgi:hypothetical protein
MNSDLAQNAINAALKGSWKDAIEINLHILQNDRENTDALNRLARAYAETGDLTNARLTAQKVLKVDMFNTIAIRSLEKWKDLKKGDVFSTHLPNVEMFLEEPGKTKICSLLFIGDNKILAKLNSADEVKFDTHSHRVCICTQDNKYIGRLPDDLSARLKKLIKLGNTYKVYIKSTDKNDVKVFIKEIKRDKKINDIPSFTAEKIDYVTFTPPELVHDKSEINNGSEDDDV